MSQQGNAFEELTRENAALQNERKQLEDSIAIYQCTVRELRDREIDREQEIAELKARIGSLERELKHWQERAK